jgi:RimJ/RimL family protein N-acetyltransferase/8-oxo-dGTP pyrophosphatase MutT (NUDIX family)
MRDPNCVGALIRDHRNRVYAQRRTPARRVLPGIGDIVGGHLDAGETPELALARELEEETGWKLRRVEAVIADWEWEWDGVVRRELDYLVEVDGDPGEPTLAPREHDAFAWVGPDNLELMMEGRTDGDRRLRDVVAKAVRIRLTPRLRLEPIGPEHADDLWRLHRDEAVARWYGKTWTREGALRYATRRAEQWEAHGVDKWIAYDRASGELVGRGGLSRKEDEPERLEVGWTVRSDLWGRGYATEIGRAGLALAFDELGADEVVAFTGPDNQRSRAVMERLGMGDPRDIVYMGDAVVLYTLPRGRATAAGRAALHRWDDPRTTGDG